MKRINTLLLMFVLSLNMMAHAANILDGCQNAMYFRAIKTDNPNYVELSLCLKNSSFAVKSLQCTVVLPDGASFLNDDSGYKITKGNVIDGNWTLMARHKVGDQDNSAIVLLYNDSNSDEIATGDREIASIPLTLSNGDALNGTGVYIKDVILTGSNLEEYSGDAYAFNFYNLTYYVDGVEYYTEDLKAGDEIIPTPIPTIDGYTFSGWSEIPGSMPAGNVVVNGSFNVNKYSLTYMVDGAVYHQDSIEYGAAVTVIEEPSMEGNTFSGWVNTVDTMPSRDVIISGTFSVNSYLVKYYVDSVDYQTVIYPYGSEIVALAEPTKVGYTFSGWSNVPATMPAQDIDITGVFSINSYLLTYMVEGNVYKTDTIKYNAAITALAGPVKEGYTFSGWNGVPNTMPAENVVATGSFYINYYNLIYMVDGKDYKIVNYKYCDTVTVEKDPSKEGYTFLGWSEVPTTMPANDVEVNGTFSINSYVLTYKVDSAVYKIDTLKYATSITPLPEPAKEGYTFSGWSDVPSTMPAGDVEIIGSFIINSYYITYMVDGEVYRRDTIEYGAALSIIEEPTLEGMLFSGWDDTPKVMPSHDVVISGTFTPIIYQLVVMIDGKVVYSDSIAYGTRLADYVDLIIQKGIDITQWEWYDKIESITMPAHDVIINAVLDAVRPIVTDADNDVLYDLIGRKIEVDDMGTLPSGIYIRNGCKIVIR